MPSGIYIRTQEAILANRLGHIGLKLSKETKKKMSLARRGIPLNERAGNWRGDKVGYQALHAFIRRHLAKPFACNHCEKSIFLELANKSGEYKREFDDWLWLCRSCHSKYDEKPKKAWITRRERYGEKGHFEDHLRIAKTIKVKK